MTLALSQAGLIGFLLAMVRVAAWLVITPPFATRAMPAPAKVAFAAALALPMVNRTAPDAPALEVVPLAAAAISQAVAGVALGFLTYLLFAAVQAAGDLIDVFGGFSLAFGFDPLSLSSNSVFGRLHQLLATTLLFAVDGHIVLVRGFLHSFETLPIGDALSMSEFVEILVHDLGVYVLAAIQIAAPLLAVLFITDVGLGLLSRIAPALNAFSLSFPAKILLTLVLAGMSFPMLPDTVRSLVEAITRSVLAVTQG